MANNGSTNIVTTDTIQNIQKITDFIKNYKKSDLDLALITTERSQQFQKNPIEANKTQQFTPQELFGLSKNFILDVLKEDVKSLEQLGITNTGKVNNNSGLYTNSHRGGGGTQYVLYALSFLIVANLSQGNIMNALSAGETFHILLRALGPQIALLPTIKNYLEGTPFEVLSKFLALVILILLHYNTFNLDLAAIQYTAQNLSPFHEKGTISSLSTAANYFLQAIGGTPSEREYKIIALKCIIDLITVVNILFSVFKKEEEGRKLGSRGGSNKNKRHKRTKLRGKKGKFLVSQRRKRTSRN
jgi:hypothetical protein